MNPLYISDIVATLRVKDHCLIIGNKEKGKVLHVFKPRQIPYDSIILQYDNGFVTFRAIDYLVKHAVNLVILDQYGNIMTQITQPSPISNKLRIAQYQTYLDKQKNHNIVRATVLTKVERQRKFLESLSEYFNIKVPKIEPNRDVRNLEARFATTYFEQYGRIVSELGYEWTGRSVTKLNMHAADLPNALLNFGYSILYSYVNRAIVSIGLDSSIGFLHLLRTGKESLCYDMTELWRICVDWSVIQTLEELKRTTFKQYQITREYEMKLSSDSRNLLIQKLRLNLELFDIISNVRLLAKYMLDETRTLEFRLKELDTRMLNIVQIKEKIRSAKSYKDLGYAYKNRSTFWYQKKQLERTGSIRIYNISRNHYV